MLNRERDAIMGVLTQAWFKHSQALQVEYNTRANAALASFEKDSRLIVAADALKALGIVDGTKIAKQLLDGASVGYTGIRLGGGLYDDMIAARSSVAKPELEDFGSDETYGIISIALNTSKKKWPDLQSDVYVLMADINAAEDYDDIRTAIRTFAMTL